MPVKCSNCKTETADLRGWVTGEYEELDEDGEVVDEYMVVFCSISCKTEWETSHIGNDADDIEQGGERQ